MIRLLLLVTCLGLAACTPYKLEPPGIVIASRNFDPCHTLKEETLLGLSARRCEADQRIDQVTLFESFRLGNSQIPFDQFTADIGLQVPLRASSDPYANITGCGRATCMFSSTAHIEVPLNVIFSSYAMERGLRIRAFYNENQGQTIFVSPERIANFRRALVAHGFIEAQSE